MKFGHSYLEADSMHATIERSKKHKTIYTTRDWALLYSIARIKTCPYKVTNIHYDDFYDLEKLVKDMLKNTTINTDNDKVNWLKIKLIRF